MYQWERVSQELTAEIEGGAYSDGARLPTNEDLAARFRVNRHTVRRAISELESRGLLRVEHGRGTFVVRQPIGFAIDPERRFEQNLVEGHIQSRRRVLSTATMTANDSIAQALDATPGAPLTQIIVVSEADGLPIAYNRSFFPQDRVPGVADAFRKTEEATPGQLEFAEILKSCGVESFRRRDVSIRCRPCVPDEARYLGLATAATILEMEVTSVTPSGVPIMHAFTGFVPAHVELKMRF